MPEGSYDTQRKEKGLSRLLKNLGLPALSLLALTNGVLGAWGEEISKTLSSILENYDKQQSDLIAYFQIIISSSILIYNLLKNIHIVINIGVNPDDISDQ